MTKDQVKIGKKVLYHPVIGGPEAKEATITSEVYAMCGCFCCKIDIMASVVDIDALEEA